MIIDAEFKETNHTLKGKFGTAYVVGGGASGGIVDQTYNPTSENAQSGKAVAQAISNAIGGVNSVLGLIVGGESNVNT